MRQKTSRLLIILLFGLVCCVACEQQRYEQGKNIYVSLCANCHMEDGSGLSKLIPNISESKILSDHQAFSCLILNGIKADQLGDAMGVMPAHPRLTDVQIVNLYHYVNAKFGTKVKEVSIADIKATRDRCN